MAPGGPVISLRSQCYGPLEKPTWTTGAVLLAIDALTGHTAASDLFLGSAVDDAQ